VAPPSSWSLPRPSPRSCKTPWARALAKAREDTAPALLDRSDIARRLGVSPSTVDRLRREGMPATFVCSSPRFELDRCLDWLRAHSQPSER
jgi:hypothetical protein